MSRGASSPALTLLVCGLALLAPPPAQANLIPNPSLETADPADPAQPEGWLPDVWGGVKASFQWLTSGANGARSVRVEVLSRADEGDAKWWSKPFAVPAGGGVFEVRDSYRASAQSELLVQIFDDAGASDWLTVKVAPASSGWAQAAGVVTLPPATTRVQVAHVVSTPGWLETDSYWMDRKTASDGGAQDAGTRDGREDLGRAGQGALVSVVFDDGWASVYAYARPILRERGLRASHFIVAGYVDRPGYQSDYMTADQITELTYLGHEVGSHSRSHEDLTEVADLEDEVVESKRMLEKLGYQVAGFVPPGGAYDDRVLELARANYRYMRTVEGGLNVPPYDLYRLKCVVVINTTPLSEVAAWVQQAAAEKSWLILLYHRLGNKADYDTFVTTTRFRQDMDYLVASGAEVRPMGEVLKVWTPATPPPPVETGKSLPRLDPGGCSWAGRPVPGVGSAATLAVLLAGLVRLARRRRRVA